MDPKNSSKKAGFLNDDSIDDNFSQPEIGNKCKDVGNNPNAGIGLIDTLPGAEN